MSFARWISTTPQRRRTLFLSFSCHPPCLYARFSTRIVGLRDTLLSSPRSKGDDSRHDIPLSIAMSHLLLGELKWIDSFALPAREKLLQRTQEQKKGQENSEKGPEPVDVELAREVVNRLKAEGSSLRKLIAESSSDQDVTIQLVHKTLPSEMEWRWAGERFEPFASKARADPVSNAHGVRLGSIVTLLGDRVIDPTRHFAGSLDSSSILDQFLHPCEKSLLLPRVPGTSNECSSSSGLESLPEHWRSALMKTMDTFELKFDVTGRGMLRLSYFLHFLVGGVGEYIEKAALLPANHPICNGLFEKRVGDFVEVQLPTNEPEALVPSLVNEDQKGSDQVQYFVADIAYPYPYHVEMYL